MLFRTFLDAIACRKAIALNDCETDLQNSKQKLNMAKTGTKDIDGNDLCAYHGIYLSPLLFGTGRLVNIE